MHQRAGGQQEEGLFCHSPTNGYVPQEVNETFGHRGTCTGRVPCEDEGRGFPGGAVAENLPASAGDTGSSPGPGRCHMPRSNWAREPQLLSLSAVTTEPARLELVLDNKRSHRNEKPVHRNEE
ncbi:hypothetical protein J1605_001975 [Eschrichtius robustus]|uniref:Uncharacterized protein n=1 Tax=Eschrichtius robustus TaxID=9764 RepID=A0AB34GNX1_ESCRO|nr:hypothetical protein J1605_010441 [Eschrichtius robustus]KAJ8796904.1 hypothetical protein J1605_001975 [Eschrichtius robustus]